MTWFGELMTPEDMMGCCKLQLIPLTYVAPPSLIDQLKNLQRTASDFGHELVIPISQISEEKHQKSSNSARYSAETANIMYCIINNK